MKTKMASASTLAKENIEQLKSYRQTFGESRKILKMRIGETLLCFVAGQVQPSDWQQLERLMRRFYQVREWA